MYFGYWKGYSCKKWSLTPSWSQYVAVIYWDDPGDTISWTCGMTLQTRRGLLGCQQEILRCIWPGHMFSLCRSLPFLPKSGLLISGPLKLHWEWLWNRFWRATAATSFMGRTNVSSRPSKSPIRPSRHGEEIPCWNWDMTRKPKKQSVGVEKIGIPGGYTQLIMLIIVSINRWTTLWVVWDTDVGVTFMQTPSLVKILDPQN